jgi:very-short-patch-repair endonuclease
VPAVEVSVDPAVQGELTVRSAEAVELSVDVSIAALAGRQKGLVTRVQLLNAGVGRSAIDDRLRRGALHAVHRGVYLVGHAIEPPLAREMAALLACGEDSLLSHRSAGALWRLVREWNGPVEVTVPRRLRRPGITTHCNALLPQDRRTRDNLRLTSPTRTLLDLAAVLDQDALEQAVAQATRLRLTTEAELTRQLSHPRPGTAALKAILTRRPRMTRSGAERKLLNLLREARLPLPETNVHVAGHEVDLLWREHRLIVEFDGFAYHSDRRAYEQDRLRDADLQAAGYRVVRVTWRQLEDGSAAVLARLAQMLVSLPAA